MGRVKQQPIDDVDLLLVVLSEHRDSGFITPKNVQTTFSLSLIFFYFRRSHLQRLVVMSEIRLILPSHCLHHQLRHSSNVQTYVHK